MRGEVHVCKDVAPRVQCELTGSAGKWGLAGRAGLVRWGPEQHSRRWLRARAGTPTAPGLSAGTVPSARLQRACTSVLLFPCM